MGEQGVGQVGTVVVLLGVGCGPPRGCGKHVGLEGRPEREGAEVEAEEVWVSQRRFQYREC